MQFRLRFLAKKFDENVFQPERKDTDPCPEAVSEAFQRILGGQAHYGGIESQSTSGIWK
jgi:hypothetical protein